MRDSGIDCVGSLIDLFLLSLCHFSALANGIARGEGAAASHAAYRAAEATDCCPNPASLVAVAASSTAPNGQPPRCERQFAYELVGDAHGQCGAQSSPPPPPAPTSTSTSAPQPTTASSQFECAPGAGGGTQGRCQCHLPGHSIAESGQRRSRGHVRVGAASGKGQSDAHAFLRGSLGLPSAGQEEGGSGCGISPVDGGHG